MQGIGHDLLSLGVNCLALAPGAGKPYTIYSAPAAVEEGFIDISSASPQEVHHLGTVRHMGRGTRLTAHDGIIELFAGAGGLTWGWRQAGFRPLAAVDHDSAAARTHELNFGRDGTLSLNRDLRVFGPDHLDDLLGNASRHLLVVAGGPPCQGWSKAGRGKLRSLKGQAESLLNDPRNSLYWQFISFVHHYRPPIYMMENVPGMLNLEGRNVAEEVAENFADIGYETTWALVNARWFGVPQDRRRLIFLGTRIGGLHLDASDLETFGPLFRSSVLHLPGETSLYQAISDLPQIEHGTREDPQLYRRRAGRISRYAEIMRGEGVVITDHVCREHNDQDLAAFKEMPQGGIYADLPQHLKRYRDDIFLDKYRRLRFDRPAGTITAHLAKDCYTHIHPTQLRTISIREAARIQSFADDFRFSGNMGDRFRQIGNAVPPLMAWGIGEYVKEKLQQFTSTPEATRRKLLIDVMPGAQAAAR
jgi:DNA (cytosine-5)-methyltransferase 1